MESPSQESSLSSSCPASITTWMSALPQVWAMPDLSSEGRAKDPANGSQTRTGDEHIHIDLERSQMRSERYQDRQESPQNMSVGIDGTEEELQARIKSRSRRPSTLENEVPRCWEHNCNGREFSTWSNLSRHRREKSKDHVKSRCPRCGLSFSRKVVWENHVRRRICESSRGKCA